MTTLEAQAKQKLYNKKHTITIKYAKLVEKSEKDLWEKLTKEFAKAERQVKQRLINKEKQAKNKIRAKEWKPLLTNPSATMFLILSNSSSVTVKDNTCSISIKGSCSLYIHLPFHL